MTARVRLATPDDAAAICRIYNQGIEDRVATLKTELRTPEEGQLDGTWVDTIVMEKLL